MFIESWRVAPNGKKRSVRILRLPHFLFLDSSTLSPVASFYGMPSIEDCRLRCRQFRRISRTRTTISAVRERPPSRRWRYSAGDILMSIAAAGHREYDGTWRWRSIRCRLRLRRQGAWCGGPVGYRRRIQGYRLVAGPLDEDHLRGGGAACWRCNCRSQSYHASRSRQPLSWVCAFRVIHVIRHVSVPRRPTCTCASLRICHGLLSMWGNNGYKTRDCIQLNYWSPAKTGVPTWLDCVTWNCAWMCVDIVQLRFVCRVNDRNAIKSWRLLQLSHMWHIFLAYVGIMWLITVSDVFLSLLAVH